MALEAQGYEIIGVSMFGPEPLSGMHFDVHPGATMLYGKNGTGKTRLLDELTRVFQGIGEPKKTSRARPLIHISVEVRPTTGDNTFIQGLYEMLDVPRDFQTEDEHREEFHTALLERINNWADLDLDDVLQLLDYPELRISQGFHLSLMPSGTSVNPKWTVYVSALLSAADMKNLAQHGKGLSEINRAIVEDADLDSASFLTKSPFRLAQANEWYTEPFDVDRDGNSPRAIYVPTQDPPMSAWPDHFPVPLVSVGVISRGPATTFVNSLPLDLIQERTLALVSRTGWRAPVVEASAGSEIVLAESVQKAVASAESEANRILGALADFPFQLSFDTGTPSDWFAGNPPRWIAVPRSERAIKVPLENLSFSEQKWVRFALSLSLSQPGHSMPRIVIVDEPEQGLHRQLESRISIGLHKLIAEFDGLAIIGATHSPAFLDPRHGSKLLHLSLTGAGKTTMTVLEIGVGRLTLDEEARRLGVSPSDLLAMTRVALVVEGTHDQIVLEECLSWDMQESGARVFVMRGTDNAIALPDMQFLFDALDAPIVVVIDNVDQLQVMPIWKRAVDAFTAKDLRLAERTLSELESTSVSKEARALVELGRRAIRVGRLNRITPFGLHQPDILDYLSPRHFNLDADDWRPFKSAFASKKRRGDSFKEFLRREYSARINVDSVRAAAAAVDSMPREFSDLGGLIRQLGYLGAIDDLEVSVNQ